MIEKLGFIYTKLLFNLLRRRKKHVKLITMTDPYSQVSYESIIIDKRSQFFTVEKFENDLGNLLNKTGIGYKV